MVEGRDVVFDEGVINTRMLETILCAFIMREQPGAVIKQCYAITALWLPVPGCVSMRLEGRNVCFVPEVDVHVRS